MSLRQGFRRVALAVTTVAAVSAGLSGALVTAIVLIVAAAVIARRPFGRVAILAELLKIVAEREGQCNERDASARPAEVGPAADARAPSVRAFVAPLLIAVPPARDVRSGLYTRCSSLLFRDEASEDNWRELASHLRMQSITSREKIFLAMWRRALAKQISL